ncbi:uncharacterized protein BDCG_16314 [Blastomyces dermatitidis ER-3]|uniref:Uncharacterized protein n=2 Tax=Blastomyces TaxID=229219 RepID=A0A179UH13_BLAGS|nr:uncharacterized protein BDBG_16645 [Blastomyces gilchristii SLH14081]XP_045279520.1 uncharacterized protein BDCG_16314 [Blastomyces dermatitidis ER-3]EQL37029.1 hypothetical protein BDFG_01647 [Blastomyces dermatitidis ATCC 26199]OAS99792.1 hypothetical protein BDCG_16314 [Blastomyces dermatitidis ER-3]OAT06519.1 hypothetical protein BDBG_16645 [Blastomyces gilchristii SLH14081]
MGMVGPWPVGWNDRTLKHMTISRKFLQCDFDVVCILFFRNRVERTNAGAGTRVCTVQAFDVKAIWRKEK